MAPPKTLPHPREVRWRRRRPDYQALALDLHPTLVLWQRVRELSNNLPAHDAHYVALAESLGVPLITSDARIERSGAARCTIETFEAPGT